jgi:Domain of unknown function (DUF1978).
VNNFHVFTTDIPSFARLLQKGKADRDEAIEKTCKAKHNVDESEYYLHLFMKRNQPNGEEYLMADTHTSSKQTSFFHKIHYSGHKIQALRNIYSNVLLPYISLIQR